MGIPSYYKKLIDTNPGLILHHHPDSVIEWLFMDFNCLIYHCLHRVDTPKYPGEDGRQEWEEEFIACIIKYTLNVIQLVTPKSGVFIAIDGVVPMAKMRQQRLRRFKSAWMAQKTSENMEPSWDTNAITPGTEFMKKLRNGLEKMIKVHDKKTWKLSSSDEPGEGEHKLISEWRKGTYKGDYAVYGLDADLILLSILGRETMMLKNNVWLFREVIDKGKIMYDSSDNELFEWFSIHELRNWLASVYTTDEMQRNFILHYCFAMSVLGNDFIPRSIGLTIRDEGHSDLLLLLHHMFINNHCLIDTTTMNIQSDKLQILWNLLSYAENERMYEAIYKKYRMSQIQSDTQTEIGENNYPLKQLEECILLDNLRHLSPQWQEKYMTTFFSGFQYTKKNIQHICKEYLYGIQWIWAYYTGKHDDICYNWYYPFSLPPLWQWISLQQLPSFPERVYVRASDIEPVEQLALVLPLQSWHLLPQSPHKNLPKWAPQFYPTTFSFDSVGKRFFWECESNIPIPSIIEVKEIISSNS